MAEEMHDLAAAYSLDALDDIDRRRFEAHLATCDDCRLEAASFGDVLAEMALRSPEDPPAGMREAVMARLAVTPQESSPETAGAGPAPADIGRGPRRSRVVVSVAAVAIAVVGLAAVLISGILDSDPIDLVLAAQDAREISLESATVEGALLTFSPQMNQAVFSATGLPPIDPDETYQLWLIDDSGPAPAGLFNPGAGGEAVVLVEGEVTVGLTLGLTVEPAAGSSAPTGDILIAQPIS